MPDVPAPQQPWTENEIGTSSVPADPEKPWDGSPSPVDSDAGPAVPPRIRRIPHLGHALLLGLFLLIGLLCTGILLIVALRFHAFGVHSLNQATQSLPYNLAAMVCLYSFTLAASGVIFPLIWKKSFLQGLQWNAAEAARQSWKLVAMGVVCFLLALAARPFLPHKSPIESMLNSPQAAWLMFAFSITIAPLAEECIFRGFLLPAACTAFDWIGEKIARRPVPALLCHEHPQWSVGAMIFAAATVSVLFALVHSSQTAGAAGPMVLLWCVSVILCAVRLKTRSLAASTLTHASYNCTLFLVMMIGTHGFHRLHP